jgi:hypothetical protein
VPLRCAVGVGLVAGCTLALQVLLTRVLSAVLAYHFSFLAISLALLGVGAGALCVYLRGAWFTGPLEPWLARFSVALALLLVATPLILVRLDYSSPGTSGVSASFALTLAAVSVLAAIPFTVAGVAIALAIRGYARSIGIVYAFDLAGAALGALAVVPLLWLVRGVTLLVSLSVVAAAAALLFAWNARRERASALVALLLTILATALAGFTPLYHLPPHTTAPAGLEPVSERWTPLSRVFGYPPSDHASIATIFYDRIYAPVPVRGPREPLADWRELRLGPQSVAYELAGPGRTLVIGGGGGRDISNALSSGQRQVDVIELNRAIVDTVERDLRPWSGGPYSRPGVSVSIGDGRALLAASDQRYDVIHIGFTDTLSANSAAGFALTEANLYTREAFAEYLQHLRPLGILAVTRLHRLVGEEAMRVTVLALDALESSGVTEPAHGVVVLLGRDIFGELYGTVLARREPWSDDELARIRELADQRGEGVAFAPGGPYRLEWAQLAAADHPLEFCRSHRSNVCPPTDDRPFFFHTTRLGALFAPPAEGAFYATDPLKVLAVTLAILSVLCALAFGLPLALLPRGVRPPVRSMAFFGAIGLGFLLLEIVLVQRFVLFLGFPTYALSVVLFALLLATGIGSWLSSRARDPRRALFWTLAGACTLIAAGAVGLQPLLRALIALPFPGRIAVALALLVPLGLLLGAAMPLGIGRLAARDPGAVPWAWAVNGATSVLASVLAVALAITLGYTAVMAAALACYAFALGEAVRVGRRPGRDRIARIQESP